MDFRQEPSDRKRHQVFLSYASEDERIAQIVRDKLRQQNMPVWIGMYELQQGDSLAEAIGRAMSASDYLVVLLSPHSVNSVWIQRELGAALSGDLAARGITVLPVMIADCEIPQPLASYQYLDLRTDLENGIDQLVQQIIVASAIDLSLLDPKAFEALVIDLLGDLGFKNIDRGPVNADLGVDLQARYSRVDPFGVEVTETWLVELKFYRHGRADLQSIRLLVDFLSRLPVRSKGLLITNGQLTSAVKDWLKSAEQSSRVEIRVIDGTELKRLLLRHQRPTSKYFDNHLV